MDQDISRTDRGGDRHWHRFRFRYSYLSEYRFRDMRSSRSVILPWKVINSQLPEFCQPVIIRFETDAVLFSPLTVGETAFTAFVNQLQPPLGFNALGWGKIVHIRPPKVRVLRAKSKNSKKSNLIISKFCERWKPPTYLTVTNQGGSHPQQKPPHRKRCTAVFPAV